MALAAIARNHDALGPEHIASLSERQQKALRRTVKRRYADSHFCLVYSVYVPIVANGRPACF